MWLDPPDPGGQELHRRPRDRRVRPRCDPHVRIDRPANSAKANLDQHGTPHRRIDLSMAADSRSSCSFDPTSGEIHEIVFPQDIFVGLINSGKGR
jgi:hypothetical protein